jgi:cobalt/nickel transport system ATP-binding protein
MAGITRLSARIDSFVYHDGTCALSDIALDIKKGSFWGLLGANGSGKTTLLKVLDGLLKGFKGSVKLDEVDIGELSPKQIYRKIGLIFQNPNDQLFASTVFEDVAFGPLNMGFNEQEVRHRVKQALESIEMGDYAHKSIHHLSFGQKKRICIAGLLAMGHEILLLDEPTDGLDPMGEHKMMNLLAKLNKEKGVTIVMATHNVDLIPLFLDQLHILNNGHIIASGFPEEVFTSPEDMSEVKLKLPQIAELIYQLKYEDRIPFDKIPLTVGEARREILKQLAKVS